MRVMQGCALALACFMSMLPSGCAKTEQASPQRPEQAGQPLNPLKTAGRMAAIRGAAILGDQEAKNGVRFTYHVVVADFAGRWAGRTLAKRWVLASTIARKSSRP